MSHSRILRVHGWTLVVLSAAATALFGATAFAPDVPRWFAIAIGTYGVATAPLLWFKVALPGFGYIHEADVIEGRTRP